MIKEMAKALKYMLIKISMMVIGSMMQEMVKEFLYGQMGIIMKANGKIIKLSAQVKWFMINKLKNPHL